MDKEKFFNIIDKGAHLNSETREDYWNFFSGKCTGDLSRLYQEGEVYFTSGIHEYVKYSIDESKVHKESDSRPEKKSDIVKPLKSPTERKENQENVTSWGTNVDVKGK